MLFVLSPAKTLNEHAPLAPLPVTIPSLLDHSLELIQRARHYQREDLMALMEISPALAELNYQRFQNWHTPFTEQNARAALLMFQGDVYEGLAADSLQSDDFIYAQQHLRILSGLYGLLRPLDLMQAYRLEMGRKIDTTRGKNLYEFWAGLITDQINTQLTTLETPYLINLASQEYWKAVKPKLVKAPILTIDFRDLKAGQYKTMGVYAKRARGLFARFAILQKITQVEALKAFNSEGYQYNGALSTEFNWVFTRDHLL